MAIYYTCKNIRQQNKKNKFKIIALMCNDDFELPEGSYLVSDIQNYINYNVKSKKKLPTNPPIHIYIFTSTGLIIG